MDLTSSISTWILLNYPKEQVSGDQHDSKLANLPLSLTSRDGGTVSALHQSAQRDVSGYTKETVGILSTQKGYSSKEIHFKTQQN